MRPVDYRTLRAPLWRRVGRLLTVRYLQLLGVQVLGPSEHVALGDPLTAELVDLDHASEGDESDQRGGGQQRQGHLQRLLQSLQVLVLHAGVHHVQEDQRHLGTALRAERHEESSQGVTHLTRPVVTASIHLVRGEIPN